MKGSKKIKMKIRNKKGEIKEVSFYMEEATYELLYDEKISENFRYQYLIDEYYEYEKERTYRRKHLNIDIEIMLNQIIIEENHEIEISNELFQNEKLNNAYKKLTKRQKEFIKLKFIKNKTQEEIAKEYKITKQSVSDAMHRIYDSLRKNMTKK